MKLLFSLFMSSVSTLGSLSSLGCKYLANYFLIELSMLLKVGSEEIGSSPCKCSPLLSLTFVEIKKSFT